MTYKIVKYEMGNPIVFITGIEEELIQATFDGIFRYFRANKLGDNLTRGHMVCTARTLQVHDGKDFIFYKAIEEA